MPLHRLAALVSAATLAGAAAVLLPHSAAGLRELVLATGAAAPLLALGAWVVLTPALFPGTLLAAAGGLAFGALGGAALAWGGAVLGALAAFTLARTVGRRPVLRLAQRSPRIGRAHAFLERRGFAAVLAARMMPGVPAGWLYYVAGASPVGVRPFTAATAAGALLRTTPYALLGQGLASGSLAAVALAAAGVAIGCGASVAILRHHGPNRAGSGAPSHR
jgi:uncharacterized membrane protein YdjX (TVP38/TMEM64 family)